MRLLTTLLLTLLAYAAITVGVSGATGAGATTPEIVGVWSFNGGTVDITAQSEGTFVGTVSTPTKFSKCVHPVGEKMWTEMRLQSDGSYWGFHRWYGGGEGPSEPHCEPNQIPGPTAWRVLHNEKGEKYLRVCFSEPGSGLQPTIAANGSDGNVDYGCESSGSLASQPPEPTLAKSVTTPSCVAHNILRIQLRKRRYDPFKLLTIRVNGKKALRIRGIGKLRKPIVLTKLPSGSFTLQIQATTLIGQTLTGSRRYSACGGSSSEVKLHAVKKRHRRKHRRHHRH